jgi:hypothetical protein
MGALAVPVSSASVSSASGAVSPCSKAQPAIAMQAASGAIRARCANVRWMVLYMGSAPVQSSAERHLVGRMAASTSPTDATFIHVGLSRSLISNRCSIAIAWRLPRMFYVLRDEAPKTTPNNSSRLD